MVGISSSPAPATPERIAAALERVLQRQQQGEVQRLQEQVRKLREQVRALLEENAALRSATQADPIEDLTDYWVLDEDDFSEN